MHLKTRNLDRMAEPRPAKEDATQHHNPMHNVHDTRRLKHMRSTRLGLLPPLPRGKDRNIRACKWFSLCRR